MRTRQSFVITAYAIVVVIAALLVVSWITNLWAVLAWPAAALLMALAIVITALRGQTKGQAKRDRDEQVVMEQAPISADADMEALTSDQVGL